MPARKPLRICLAASEMTPLAKTGGLADVVPALARALIDAGHDVGVDEFRCAGAPFATDLAAGLRPATPGAMGIMAIEYVPTASSYLPIGADRGSQDFLGRLIVGRGPWVSTLY